MKNVLITGGAGYIGTHCVCELVRNGSYNVIAVDNLTNSKPQYIKKLESRYPQLIKFFQIDLLYLSLRVFLIGTSLVL